MANAHDWVGEVAEQAAQHVGVELRRTIATLIAEHCPLAPDTAYMVVPRCETCRYWTPPRAAASTQGVCVILTAALSAVAVRPPIVIAVAPGFGCVEWAPRDEQIP
jgi:hypothetical protein